MSVRGADAERSGGWAAEHLTLTVLLLRQGWGTWGRGGDGAVLAQVRKRESVEPSKLVGDGAVLALEFPLLPGSGVRASEDTGPEDRVGSGSTRDQSRRQHDSAASLLA